MPYACERLKLSVMGRPVLIGASEAGLLDAAARSYAVWTGGARGTGAPIELTLEAGEQQWTGGEARIVVDGARLLLTGSGIEGWADVTSLSAFCRIPKGLELSPGDLAREAIDTLVLFLITRSGRVPVHAAGVRWGDVALVLAGPSGSGKSTLSLAAMARGLEILSDDTVYIQLQPGLRIWGFPRPVHVFPDDAPRFSPATRLRNGKLKAAVPLPERQSPPVADRAVLILLERGAAISLERVAPAAAMRALAGLEPGFDLLARESAAAAAALAAPGAWRLTLARDPAAAVEQLLKRLAPEMASAEAAPL
jgi:hypothetical protein